MEGHLGHGLRDVLHFAVSGEVVRHPGGVLILVGGVDHHQVGPLPDLVDDEVVHAAAGVVAHGGVADLAVGHVGKVVGEHVVEVLEGVRAGKDQLSHVGDVKKPGGGADGHVLGDDAGGVLDRQQVPREGDDLPAQRHMAVVKRRLLFHWRSLLSQNW